MTKNNFSPKRSPSGTYSDLRYVHDEEERIMEEQEWNNEPSEFPEEEDFSMRVVAQMPDLSGAEHAPSHLSRFENLSRFTLYPGKYALRKGAVFVAVFLVIGLVGWSFFPGSRKQNETADQNAVKETPSLFTRDSSIPIQPSSVPSGALQNYAPFGSQASSAPVAHNVSVTNNPTNDFSADNGWNNRNFVPVVPLADNTQGMSGGLASQNLPTAAASHTVSVENSPWNRPVSADHNALYPPRNPSLQFAAATQPYTAEQPIMNQPAAENPWNNGNPRNAAVPTPVYPTTQQTGNDANSTVQHQPPYDFAGMAFQEQRGLYYPSASNTPAASVNGFDPYSNPAQYQNHNNPAAMTANPPVQNLSGYSAETWQGMPPQPEVPNIAMAPQYNNGYYNGTGAGYPPSQPLVQPPMNVMNPPANPYSPNNIGMNVPPSNPGLQGNNYDPYNQSIPVTAIPGTNPSYNSGGSVYGNPAQLSAEPVQPYPNTASAAPFGSPAGTAVPSYNAAYQGNTAAPATNYNYGRNPQPGASSQPTGNLPANNNPPQLYLR
ncbi:MAG: hypothetical protein LBQ54_14580 [Planctomycetaceae bacterium]|jgi:hypothetical protein|nr:hypothetical protein [Planctomycetaceae bacterium]